MHLVKMGTQGFWHQPDPDKFKPPCNADLPYVKPRTGGIWTSSWDETNGTDWLRWCQSESFSGPSWDMWLLEPDPDAVVVQISEFADLAELIRKYPHPKNGWEKAKWGKVMSSVSLNEGLDFEKLAEDFHGVNLTQNGQWATRYSNPGLYGWDCESTLWLRWNFVSIEHYGIWPRATNERRLTNRANG